jgi:hypothetical protein
VTALVLVAVRAEPLAAAAESGTGPAATPYSDMHAQVQQAPGEPEEPAPTF